MCYKLDSKKTARGYQMGAQIEKKYEPDIYVHMEFQKKIYDKIKETKGQTLNIVKNC